MITPFTSIYLGKGINWLWPSLTVYSDCPMKQPRQDWFESYLLDYDVASNWTNWVFAAGLNGRVNRFNVVKQSKQRLVQQVVWLVARDVMWCMLMSFSMSAAGETRFFIPLIHPKNAYTSAYTWIFGTKNELIHCKTRDGVHYYYVKCMLGRSLRSPQVTPLTVAQVWSGWWLLEKRRFASSIFFFLLFGLVWFVLNPQFSQGGFEGAGS